MLVFNNKILSPFISVTLKHKQKNWNTAIFNFNQQTVKKDQQTEQHQNTWLEMNPLAGKMKI